MLSVVEASTKLNHLTNSHNAVLLNNLYLKYKQLKNEQTGYYWQWF